MAEERSYKAKRMGRNRKQIKKIKHSEEKENWKKKLRKMLWVCIARFW